MIQVYWYDWNANVTEVFGDLKHGFHGKTCYFYPTDVGGGDFCLVVSETPLTDEQIEEEIKKNKEEDEK